MRAVLLAACLMTSLCAVANGPVAVPEPTDEAMSYYYVRNTLWLIGVVWGLALPALFLFTGWSAKIRDAARRVSARWPVTVLAYLIIYGAIQFALGLPLAYYGDFVVEHGFGLSNQAFGKWLTDALIQLGVALAIGYIVVLGLYQLLRKSPRRWWLYSGLAAIPFVLVVLLVAPIWIEPLFNKFGPMKDHALEQKIVALAERSGIEKARVFEVDKSEDTKKMDAYVTGIGGTQRIVLSDTIIRKLDERQILFAMGHEMGHYVLGHAWKIILLLSGLIMLALYGVHRAAHGLIARHGQRFGFGRLDDIASYPLIALVAGAVLLVVMPLFNASIRHFEREADRFALEITRDNYAAASAFVKLQTDGLSNPRPNALLHVLRDNHPTLAERVEFCNTYKPWEKGEKLRYGEYFK